jgi:hypothetical protein
MMNIVQTQDQLKNFSQEQLIKEMQMPSGSAPQFLILNEIMRRQKMQQDFAAQQGGAPQSTVAEDAIAAAGVPQEGLAGMAQALAPQTDMMQNTGVGAVQQMYAGGPVKKMAEGGAVMTDPAVRTLANRMGMSVEEYLRSVGPERATAIAADAERRAANQTTSADNVFDPRLPTTDQAGSRNIVRPFEGIMADSLASELGANPTRTFGGTDIYDRGMPALPTLQETFAADNPAAARRAALPSFLAQDVPGMTPREDDFRQPAPENRPLTPDEQAMFAFGVPASELSSLGQEQPGMTTREEALAIARAKPRGSGGAIDALLAGGAPDGMRVNPAQFLPRPEDMVAPERALDPMDRFREDFGESTGPGFAFDLRIPRGEAPFVEPMSGIIEAGQNAEGGGSFMDMLRRALPERTSAPPPAEQPAFEDPYQSSIDSRRAEIAEESASSQDMSDLARQSAEDAAKLREAAGITESLKEPTKPAEPASQGGGAGAGGAGSGGAGGAGGMSSFEQELMSALDRREKAAEQDKWLALAQVGLNMMSSTQPTLLGAVGEAGLKGVEAARGARDQYEKDRMELLGAMEQSRMARAAAAASAAKGAQGKPINPAIIKLLEEKRAAAVSALAAVPPPDPGGWFSGPTDPDSIQRTELDKQVKSLDNALAQAYSTYGLGGVEASGEGLDFNATQ